MRFPNRRRLLVDAILICMGFALSLAKEVCSFKYAQEFTEKIPLVKAEGVQVVLDQETLKNPQAKEFTGERFYDNSLVQELINEGFYKSLWDK
jgi:hypothetical protein